MSVRSCVLLAALASILPAQQALLPDGSLAGAPLPVAAPLAQGAQPAAGPDGVVCGGGPGGVHVPLAVTAGFTTFGSGCTGTGSGACGPGYICTTGNGTQTTNTAGTMVPNATFVVWSQALSARSIGGFQMLVKAATAGVTTAHLFLDDGAGGPAATPVRTGLMAFSPDSHWATVTFARPYVVSTNQLYFLGFDNPSPSIHPLSSSGGNLTHYWRTSASAAWTGPFNTLAWTIRVVCSENPCLSANGEATASAGGLVTDAIFLMRVEAETRTAVSGFQLPVKGAAAGSTETYIYRADASGRPMATPAAMGVMRFTTDTIWQPTTFVTPEVFSAGSTFFIGFLNPDPTLQVQPTAGTNQTHFWRRTTSTSWGGPFTTTRWAYKVDKNQTYCVTLNGAATANATTPFATNAIFLISQSTTSSIELAGFELLLRGPAEGAMPAYLYLADATGAPTGAPLRETTIAFGTGTTWSRATFPFPYMLNAGARYCIGFLTPPTGSIHPVTTSGTMGTHYWRSATATAFNGPFNTQRWAYRIFCGTGADRSAPAMGHRGYPVLGQTYSVDLNFAAPRAAAVHFLGISKSSFGGLPLPFPLGHLGALGCSLRVSPDLGVVVGANAAGHGTLSLRVPLSRALEGARLYHQWAVLDPLANGMGLVLSDGGESLIGR